MKVFNISSFSRLPGAADKTFGAFLEGKNGISREISQIFNNSLEIAEPINEKGNMYYLLNEDMVQVYNEAGTFSYCSWFNEKNQTTKAFCSMFDKNTFSSYEAVISKTDNGACVTYAKTQFNNLNLKTHTYGLENYEGNKYVSSLYNSLTLKDEFTPIVATSTYEYVDKEDNICAQVLLKEEPNITPHPNVLLDFRKELVLSNPQTETYINGQIASPENTLEIAEQVAVAFGTSLNQEQ